MVNDKEDFYMVGLYECLSLGPCLAGAAGGAAGSGTRPVENVLRGDFKIVHALFLIRYFECCLA